MPLTLDFYRTPIFPLESRQSAEENTTSNKPVSEAEAAAPPNDVSPRQVPDNIYGSVSVEDISTAVKALLHQRGMTGLVVLPDEQVQFVNIAGTKQRANKVKRLGEYTYEIRIKGHDERIRRNVRVMSNDGAEPKEDEAPPSGPGSAVSVGAMTADDMPPATS